MRAPGRSIFAVVAGAVLMVLGAGLMHPGPTLLGAALIACGALDNPGAVWDARDAMALAGVSSIVLGVWFVHPAPAFVLMGAGLLWLWDKTVPEEGAEPSAPSERSPSFEQASFDATIRQAAEKDEARRDRLAASAVAAEARDLVTTQARAGATTSRPALPGRVLQEAARRAGNLLPGKDVTSWPR